MTYVLVFATSAIVAFVGSAAVRRVAVRYGALVPPRADRWHKQPTPSFGGAAIVAGVIAASLLNLDVLVPAIPVLAAGLGLFVIGWYDDLWSLSALAKMVNTLAVASFFVFSLYFYQTNPSHSALGLIAIVWFSGLDNAVNLLDNMDGLASGVTAIAALALATTFHQELGPGLTMVLVALAGGLLAFLAWNRPPAKLFMGNCGSLAVGGILAGCSTVAVLRAGTVTAALAAGLILITPLFDTTFVIGLRRLAGRSPTRGNIDHTSHRLVSAGFSEPSALAILYALGLGGAVSGWIVHAHNGWGWPLAAIVSVGTLILGLFLARVPAFRVRDAEAFPEEPSTPLLSDLNFRWHAAEVLLDLVLIAICYYTAYRVRFELSPDLPVFLSTFTFSLPVILGCKLAALYASGLYSRMWSTFGLYDLATVLRGVAGGSMLSVLAATWLFKFEGFSRGVFIIDAVLLAGTIMGSRLSFRVIARLAARDNVHRRRVVIYGAGARGQLLVRELLANATWKLEPVAFVDDDQSKRSKRIMGVPVKGSIDDLGDVLGTLAVEEVLLSSLSINGSNEVKVRELCALRQIPVRRLYLEIR